jgi:hypothetical protein
MNLTLQEWDLLPECEQLDQMRRLQSGLPTGFSFRVIRHYELGGERHAIAEFDHGGSTFVLIPGGTQVIGFDENREWIPTRQEQEDWDSTAAEYQIEHTIHEQIRRVTLRPRVVSLKPMLVEANAQEIGWTTATLDAPDVLKVLRDFDVSPALGGSEHVGDVHVRVRRDSAGSFVAQRSQRLSHADLASVLKENGMRLLTSDEWEYVCGGGSKTLFRWGDHAPCDRYPTDRSPEEREWGHEWVISGGTLKPPAGGFEWSRDLHQRPNAFGLTIALNPYQMEVVAEPDIVRGGDGGCIVCGGAGFFLGWLTLATSYLEAGRSTRDENSPLQVGYTFARRVITL